MAMIVMCYCRHHMSPLLLASYKGKCTLVTELLATGADVNKQDSRGWSVSSDVSVTGYCIIALQSRVHNM